MDDNKMNPPANSIYYAVGITLFLAVIYSFCFTGTGVWPCVSASIFTFITMLLAVILLKKTELEKNTKGYFWFIPAAILASMNGIFSLTFINYTNAIVIFALITFAIGQATGAKFKPFTLAFLDEFIRYTFSVFTDTIPFIKSVFTVITGGKKSIFFKILLAIVISAPILIIVAMLLLSADRVFSYYTGELLSRFSNGSAIISHLVTIIIMFAVFGGYVRHIASKIQNSIQSPVVMIESIMSGTFLALMNLLFFLFCIIQVLFLFTGGFLKLPDNLVYSEYARQGFFQLLFVTVINFAALLAFLTVINGGQTSKWIRRLLIMLCVFTGILIASSFYRMALYIYAYNYTPLRMQVLTFLTMESVLLVITLAYLLMKRRQRRFDFIHTGGMACLIFYIIVNITGSGFFSDYLNIQAYKADHGAGIDIENFSEDSYGLLLGLYSDPELDNNIRILINNRANYLLNSDSNWQNWSLMKAISNNSLECFVNSKE